MRARYVCILLFATGSPLAAQTGPPVPGDPHPMPDSVADFGIEEIHVYPNPSLGRIYRYRNGTELKPDVYHYPLTETAINGGEDAVSRARAEATGFLGMLDYQQSRGVMKSYEVVSSREVPDPRGGPEIGGWHLYATLQQSRGVRETHLYVFALREELVKVRATFSPDSASAKDLDSFVGTLMAGVLARLDSGAPRPILADHGPPDAFDLAAGVWDWGGTSACKDNRQTITFSADRSHMTIVLDRPDEQAQHAGRYRVLAWGDGLHPASPHVLQVQRVDEVERTGSGEVVAWDLIIASPTRFHWRRNDWPERAVTHAMVRCDGTRSFDNWTPPGS